MITVSPLTCLEPVLAKAQMELMYLASALPLMGGQQTADRRRLCVDNFSLQEAIDYALKNNRTAKNAARDIKAAELQKWETTATGLPQINATVDYQNWLKQQVTLLPAELTGGTPGTFIPVNFSTKQSIYQPDVWRD